MRFLVRRKKTARIADRRLALPGGENSRRHLAVFDRQVAGTPHRSCPITGGDCRRLLDEAIHAPIFLPARHRQ